MFINLVCNEHHLPHVPPISMLLASQCSGASVKKNHSRKLCFNRSDESTLKSGGRGADMNDEKVVRTVLFKSHPGMGKGFLLRNIGDCVGDGR